MSKEATTHEWPVADIRVAKRYRKDLGDVDELAASIAAVGLIAPIVILGSGRLIAGRRRLAAVKLLGWKTVPVRVMEEPR